MTLSGHSEQPKLYAGRPILDTSAAIGHIRRLISDGRPAAIGKIGATECNALRFGERWFRPPFPRNLTWKRPARPLYDLAGVYPMRKDIFNRTIDLYRDVLAEVDVLIAWFNKGEEKLIQKYAPQAALIPFPGLDCFNQKDCPPWTQALAGKRVLVASPFTESIRRQYPKRREIWAKYPYEMLPEFELITMKMPHHSYMLKEAPYPDWFAALEDFQRQMDRIDFDVLLVGAGAWGLPLCAHARRREKIGIHLGGSTQVLFGITGKRWLDENRPVRDIVNGQWIRPSSEETPENIHVVEEGCYW